MDQIVDFAAGSWIVRSAPNDSDLHEKRPAEQAGRFFVWSKRFPSYCSATGRRRENPLSGYGFSLGSPARSASIFFTMKNGSATPR
jgi:hypothetical protein